eukprot:751146-Hanusia_phi.AAC.1
MKMMTMMMTTTTGIMMMMEVMIELIDMEMMEIIEMVLEMMMMMKMKMMEMMLEMKMMEAMEMMMMRRITIMITTIMFHGPVSSVGRDKEAVEVARKGVQLDGNYAHGDVQELLFL